MALSCCNHLATVLGAKVVFSGSSAYQTTEKSYWSIQEASLVPSCIVRPHTAEDVADVVSFVANNNTACQFAIKGQTHAPAAGFANIDDGITIDTTTLHTVELNKDHSTVHIGAGASWLAVYSYLDPYNLTAPGGRNGAVGVAGLTIGGGISYFGPRVGWTCDNVVNFEVVLPSGTLANANASSHADLFRALKGGANNFGVVTRVDIKPIPYHQISVNIPVQTIDHREAVFKAFAAIAGAPQYDIYASIVTGLLFNSTAKLWTIASTAAYTKAVLHPPVYKELMSIPSVSNKSILTNLSAFSAEAQTPPLNWFFWTGTYNVSASLLSSMFNIFNESLYDFNVPGGVIWSFALEPLPTAFTDHGAVSGGNSQGTSPGDGNLMILLLSALWPNTTSNAVVETTARQLGQKVNAQAKKMGLFREFQYANYADSDQRPLDSYGPQSMKYLRTVSRKYDPKGVFQKQVPGGFKLW